MILYLFLDGLKQSSMEYLGGRGWGWRKRGRGRGEGGG